jgi:hypothetical protein
MNINLHIERLILDGLPVRPGENRTLQIALEHELSRLVLASGLPPTFSTAGAVPHVGPGTVRFSERDNAKQLGTKIAQSVHQGLSSPEQAKR